VFEIKNITSASITRALCEKRIAEEYKLKKILTLTASLLVSGCSIMTIAYTAFDDDLARLLGKSLKEAYIFRIGYLRNVEPSEVQELVGGNKIYTYNIEYKTREFFFSKPKKKWQCTVKLEINSQLEIINSSSARGEGCWRPV